MKFRKKPVVIEAVTWWGKYSDPTEWPDWFNDAMNAQTMFPLTELPCPLVISTSEGEMKAQIGDKIIRGIKGELYPCKPDVFVMTYEAAEGSR
jgi:hypothetical protein